MTPALANNSTVTGLAYALECGVRAAVVECLRCRFGSGGALVDWIALLGAASTFGTCETEAARDAALGADVGGVCSSRADIASIGWLVTTTEALVAAALGCRNGAKGSPLSDRAGLYHGAAFVHAAGSRRRGVTKGTGLRTANNQGYAAVHQASVCLLLTKTKTVLYATTKPETGTL